MSLRIFVVTGANKGIGYGIVKSLAEKIQNGTIYLTGKFIKKIIKKLLLKFYFYYFKHAM